MNADDLTRKKGHKASSFTDSRASTETPRSLLSSFLSKIRPKKPNKTPADSSAMHSKGFLTDPQFKAVVDNLTKHLDDYSVNQPNKDRADFARKNPPPPQTLSLQKANGKLRMRANLQPEQLAEAWVHGPNRSPIKVSEATPENAKGLLQAKAFAQHNIEIVLHPDILATLSEDTLKIYEEHRAKYAENKSTPQGENVPSSPSETSQSATPNASSQSSTTEPQQALQNPAQPIPMGSETTQEPQQPGQPDRSPRDPDSPRRPRPS